MDYSIEMVNKVNDKIKLIVGLTGPIYSGCTTTAKYLERIEHFGRISISKMFIDPPLWKEYNRKPEREEKQNYGDEKRMENPAHFVERSVEKINEIIKEEGKGTDCFVVECLRNHAEVLEFRRLFQEKFFLIAIYASRDTRRKRAKTNSTEFNRVERMSNHLSFFSCFKHSRVF
jgi:dephospho-CoA kinase